MDKRDRATGRGSRTNKDIVKNLADSSRLLTFRETDKRIKISDADFMEAAEAWDGQNIKDLARTLDVDESQVRSRLKGMQTIFTQEAKRQLCYRALTLVRHLMEQSAAGDTAATKLALEIAGVYNPRAPIDLTIRYNELLNINFTAFTEDLDATELRQDVVVS